MVPEAYASGTFVTPYYIYKRTLLFFVKNGCCLKHFFYLCNKKRNSKWNRKRLMVYCAGIINI